jgi:4-amino-4-deoxy-L-arabinose transferase-like glycosyltransferase
LNNLSKRFSNWIPIFLIAAVAIFLRVYAIDRLPPGLFGDEAVEGLDALDVLAGNLDIWFHAHLGREPLYVYLTALSYAAFGVTPLATRLPALIAGLLTIPAAYFFVREWSAQFFSDARARRLALLTSALLAISFWHIQMTRNAHRDTLLPLVEAMGYAFLWRALRTRDLRMFAAAGAALGLAIYTYSPGRFVGVFVAAFVVVELVIYRINKDERRKTKDEFPSSVLRPSSFVGLALAALLALFVMLPLGIYFAQNPAQFSRRFASVSIFDQDSPARAFASSVSGNLAQFVVPGAGYQSKHYNLPGKPVFDLFLAPWFLAGILLALTRWRQSAYRFLLLWFIVLLMPAFLTADMIPKGVRVFGVVPGVFVFPALAMDWLSERALNSSLREAIVATDRARLNRMELALPNLFSVALVIGLVALALIGSAAWTTYDYFVAFANLPELPLAFDTDFVEVSDFIARQPADQPIYVSAEVYRHPTFMLLAKRVPTSQYFERATRIREIDARAALVTRADEANALYVFVREQSPDENWLARLAPRAPRVGEGKYYDAFRLGGLALPQQSANSEFNPLLRLIGASRFDDGIALYWQVAALPTDRAETRVTLTLFDARGAVVTQGSHRFGVPPMEWGIGDVMVEWYALPVPENASQFRVQLARGAEKWESPALPLK